ncbi:unnamed protein product [Cuscuta campestris]|uniref:Uncharacterized protein n=1 Tax=Cuscuta campestris TaxID=132261 RepID=A0A484LL93_9ASTE|nr:unnamed protein product [Cuscuta campestris]
MGHASPSCKAQLPTRKLAGKGKAVELGDTGDLPWNTAKGKKKNTSRLITPFNSHYNQKWVIEERTGTTTICQNSFHLLDQSVDTQPSHNIAPNNPPNNLSHTTCTSLPSGPHSPSCRRDPPDTNTIHEEFFPSLSEAKEYAKKIPKSQQQVTFSVNTPTLISMDDCLHINVDLGLGFLLGPQHCHNSPAKSNNAFQLGYHSEVYGKHTGIERRQLWNDISNNIIVDTLWIVGGDFNAISSIDEHKGTSTPNLTDITEFKDCFEAIPLISPFFTGGLYTWSGVRGRGRLWRRLDRALVNSKAMDFFSEVTIKHLSRATSDHKPIFLHCSLDSFKGAKPFRFQDFWISHHSFYKVVEDYWNMQPMIGGMRGLAVKLQGLKPILKAWSKDTFGDIFETVKKAELKALKAQEDYETNPGDTLKCLANQANAELIVASNRVTTYWKQKAHLKWMELGDQNSSFFHSYVKGRRASPKIRSVSTAGGKKLFQEEDIKNEAVEYFKNVFSSITLVDDQEILRHIPTLITTEDNNSMTLIPKEEEIKKAVWELNPNAASGPDGYNGVFFRTCWSIIKEDVVKASQEFFMGLPIPKSFGSTFITLIPKKEDCKSFSDFRPISLSTFMSKINSRILTTRIQPLLSKIISKEQAGFQKGMGVEDQVLMTCEMAHSLDRKCESGNAIIKLDMAKAFDRIEWGFLKRVLGGTFYLSPRFSTRLGFTYLRNVHSAKNGKHRWTTLYFIVNSVLQFGTSFATSYKAQNSEKESL